MNSDPFDFSDLEDDFSKVATKKPGQYAKKQFTCEGCNGTGKWIGGTNRHNNSKCNACAGRGYFVTSKADRLKAKATRQASKAKQADLAQEANVAAIGGEDALKALIGAAAWSSFAASIYHAHLDGKALSEKQVAAITGMLAKLAAKEAAKAEVAAAAKAAAPVVNLDPIVAMFEAATASGYKKPMYRANGLRIKPGKAGALYVMTEDRMVYGMYGEQPGYEGKIESSKFFAAKDCAPNTLDKLVTIAADPKGEAIRHGQRTGTCSCCGRELTKHASIEAGIGPICAAKWGF